MSSGRDKHRRAIDAAYKSGEIVRVHCEDREDGRVDGFVAAVGPEFFVLEIFSETIWFDGFNCLRLEDVTDVARPTPQDGFLRKAMELRGLKRGSVPNIDLGSLSNLIRSAGAANEIITLHVQYDDDEEDEDYDEDLVSVCYIGKVISLSDDEVELRTITPDGEWEEETNRYDLDIVYRVDFGGGYEDALLRVANS